MRRLKQMLVGAAVSLPSRQVVNSFLSETYCGTCGKPLLFDPEQRAVFWIETDRSISCDDCHKRSLTGDDGPVQT